MSKKRKTQSRTPLAWIAVAIGAILLVAVGLTLALRGEGDETAGGTPLLQVDRQVIDYGDVKLGATVSFKITVTNAGSGTLRFSEAPTLQIAEGC